MYRIAIVGVGWAGTRQAQAAQEIPEKLAYPPADLSPYALELVAFAAAIAGKPTGPTTAAAERRSLAVVQDGYESIQHGQPVHLPTRFGAL